MYKFRCWEHRQLNAQSIWQEIEYLFDVPKLQTGITLFHNYFIGRHLTFFHQTARFNFCVSFSSCEIIFKGLQIFPIYSVCFLFLRKAVCNVLVKGNWRQHRLLSLDVWHNKADGLLKLLFYSLIFAPSPSVSRAVEHHIVTCVHITLYTVQRTIFCLCFLMCDGT